MLCLSRRQGERIRIGDDIVIVVYEISPDKVKLAIKAPREVPVHREEIYLEIQQEEGHSDG